MARPASQPSAQSGALDVVLVCRTHPEPTQTFHRRMARALAEAGVPVLRVALRRARGATAVDDDTRFLREDGGRAFSTFLRSPLRAVASLVGLVVRARSGDKEGGRLGAAGAWRDGLALADWARRRGGVARFHAQFASWEASAAMVAGRLLRTPFSFEVHNPFTLVRGRRSLAAKVRAADRVVAISEDARRRVLALVPSRRSAAGLAGRVVVVRCGVDDAGTARPAADAPRYDVVAVGSLVPRKGHDVLIDAIARVAATRPALRAAIVGDGPERARLTAAVATRAAPVSLLGAVPEPAALALSAHARVAALACVVAPDGDEDGVPVALMEAMAAGTPVVSTTVGGIPELLDGGRAGVLVPAGDAVAFASALARLLDDDDLRARLGAAGREVVRARYDLAANARAMAAALASSR